MKIQIYNLGTKMFKTLPELKLLKKFRINYILCICSTMETHTHTHMLHIYEHIICE